MHPSTDLNELDRLSAVARKLAESGSVDAARRARAAFDHLLSRACAEAEAIRTVRP